MIDSLASEYGWSIEYTLCLPIDVSTQLFHALMHRKGVATVRKQYEVDPDAKGLSERLKSIFSAEIDTTT